MTSPTSVAQIGLLLAAGALAGLVGSAGGTASLISYPALLAAGLLLVTPASIFDRVVPFLLAFAALTLLLQPQISGWLASRRGHSGRFLLPGGLTAASAYNGYWGAGAEPAMTRRVPAGIVRVIAALTGLGLAGYLWAGQRS